MTGCIDGLNKVAVRGSPADIAINIAGRGYARSDRLESSIELAAVNVIAGDRHAGPGIRRVPFQENAMRPAAGRHPEEHHPDDPENKDHQNRNRQA